MSEVARIGRPFAPGSAPRTGGVAAARTSSLQGR